LQPGGHRFEPGILQPSLMRARQVARVANELRLASQPRLEEVQRSRLIAPIAGRKMEVRPVERKHSWPITQSLERGSSRKRRSTVERPQLRTQALLQLNILQTVVFSDHTLNAVCKGLMQFGFPAFRLPASAETREPEAGSRGRTASVSSFYGQATKGVR
jgi:hypothetical protein